MGFIDKAKNKAEEVAGKVKEGAGEATGNEDLEAEGQTDQASSGIKQTGEDVKDGAGDAKEAITDAFKKN